MKSFALTAFDQRWQVRVEDHIKLASAGGLFDPFTRSIFISPYIKPDAQIRTLLHEIIHLIEYYWDFDLGNHKIFSDLEIAGLLEEGIAEIFKVNKLKLP